jgi:hypothetical protein
MLELFISPRTTTRTWNIAIACYSEAVHFATLLAVYTFAVSSVCQGLYSVKVNTVYLFVLPSVIIPTMLTDSDSDSDLSSSNAVKWWLLSSSGVRKYSVLPVNQKRTNFIAFISSLNSTQIDFMNTLGCYSQLSITFCG